MGFNQPVPDFRLLEIFRTGAKSHENHAVYCGCVITEKFVYDLAAWIESTTSSKAATALRAFAKNHVGEKGGVITP